MNLSKTKPDRDPKYLAYIRTMVCAVSKCGNEQTIAHHIESGGMALKCSDYMTIPLCHTHHLEVHRGKQTFCERYDLDTTDMVGTLVKDYVVAMIRK